MKCSLSDSLFVVLLLIEMQSKDMRMKCSLADSLLVLLLGLLTHLLHPQVHQARFNQMPCVDLSFWKPSC